MRFAVAAFVIAVLVPAVLAPAALASEGPTAVDLPQGAKPIPPRPDGKPRLALVLSGGGARGAAHIGVLKVLEELHVKPDFIVATSMGSIVGGLYASGYSPDELDNILAKTDWNDLFVDAVERRDRSFRRKGDDATFLIPGKLRFKNWVPYLPRSVFGGQQLELYLRGLEIESRASGDFNDLPIPYRAVALDLSTGEGVVLDHGSVASAMRASMAVPGMFAPVVIDGRTLVDGGAAANLPIGIAQALGADAVIAVDITSPLLGAESIQSFFSVLSQWTSFATVANRIEDIKRLRPGDVLITPELGDMGFIDFKAAASAISLGEVEARKYVDKLKRFAVSDAEWAEFQKRHRLRTDEQLIVDEVKINNTSEVDTRVLESRLKVETGKPFDQKTFDASVMHAYGLDYFGLMVDKYEKVDGRGVLSLDVPGKPYSRNSLQFGASFRDDFSGDANYTFALRHLMIATNRRGGEWENVGQIGQSRLFRTSFYQPIDYAMRWFVSPSAETSQETFLLWENGDPVSEGVSESNLGSLAVGRVWSDWGEVRVGAFYNHSSGSVLIGDPSLITDDSDEHDAGMQYAFNVDTRDSVVFPQRGVTVKAFYRDSHESMGADAPRQLTHVEADIAMTVGRVTIVPAIKGQTLVQGPLSFESSCELGGFLNLSGLGTGELRGERCVLGRTTAYLQLSHIDLGPLSTAVYGGLSLEAGNVYFRDDKVTWDTLRTGGSVFVGAKTPIGPAFVAWGTTDDGEHRLYFVIGDRF
ncbi:MAG TPA: patatin-like phospholipase family protein [Candidatus Polarisedimenticolia bacterium]|nr:patatin-like phospholipase family protein [Candidatus Polarisedimenticolia bacterium]